MMAYNTSYFMYSIDMCQDVNFDLTNDIGPMTKLGLGNYFACPSKVNKNINNKGNTS